MENEEERSSNRVWYRRRRQSDSMGRRACSRPQTGPASEDRPSLRYSEVDPEGRTTFFFFSASF